MKENEFKWCLNRLVTFPQALPYFRYDHNHLRISKMGKGNSVLQVLLHELLGYQRLS